MTEPISETTDPVVALIEARRDELLGGEDSIGVQEARVADLQADLDAAVAHLATCRDEVAKIDAALALLSVPEPTEEPVP
ncbi:hypothetical protein [Nocardioides sp. SLBN-35]|uniref:hypothetical protein n=1 Tax=Nocardioides sp. SLBN-35 TaxID=2768445 RepID=UPI00115328E8|nr:hypothetical protein [Nocardioides sp. SLBN-35]TQK73359.1 hypothetical protein FBY23_5191 [Nocardioides sp. SLBN-35]